MKTGDRQYSEQRAQSFPLPMVGSRVIGDFVCRGETVRVLCCVDQQRDSGLVLRVLSEKGTTPLSQLSAGMIGHLQVDTCFFTLKILRIDPPLVEVAALPDHASSTRRESVRVPASFSVRLRHGGETAPWITGEGVNISIDGFCLDFSVPTALCKGVSYEAEVALSFSQGEKETMMLAVEVRWSTRMRAGFQVLDRSHLTSLARAVYRLRGRELGF